MWLRSLFPPTGIESLTREGWKLLREARISFRRGRRSFHLLNACPFRFPPAPRAFVRHLTPIGWERQGEKSLVYHAVLSHSIWKRVASSMRETGQISAIYPVIPVNPLIRKGHHGDLITRERIITPNPETLAAKLRTFRGAFFP